MSGEVTTCNSGAVTTTSPALTDTARTFIVAARSINTVRAYVGQLRKWREYASRAGCADLPADPIAVANWLAERAKDDEATVATLRTAVAAIRSAHEAAGQHFDTMHPAIRQVMQGISRACARETRQAAPITGEMCIELLERLGDTSIDLRDGALIALGYMFALRRSEACGIDLDRLGDGDSILRITAREIVLTEVRGKTLKGQQRERVVPRGPNVMAVAIIERWLARAAVQPGEPVLRRVFKGGDVGGRLDDQSVSRIVKARIAAHHLRNRVAADQAEREGARFSGHSLRVGFAVSAAEAGADVGAIARAGGWSGPAMPMRYSAKADQRRTSPHNLAGVGLSRPARGDGDRGA